MNPMNKNPWRGLSPYQDPALGQHIINFYGRRAESHTLTELIEDNIFCTLYGMSGSGKTSLLNAGVFPLLRDDGFFPVSLRLWMDAFESPFPSCITKKLEDAVEAVGGKIVLQAEAHADVPEEGSPEYFWTYFNARRLESKDGTPLTPVIVLDQFEEVLRARREDAETLLKQIHFLLDDSTASSFTGKVRFVVSVREDDLFLMEDCIDKCYLFEMKQGRYRLRGLSVDGAREVIERPGEELFAYEDLSAIADVILSKVTHDKNKDEISTSKLSLICSRLWDSYHSRPEGSVTKTIVEDFLKENPIEAFYKEAVALLSPEVRRYLVEKLVDDSGRRRAISQKAFESNVPNGDVLLNGEHRILQITPTSKNEQYIELLHDAFCEPVLKDKEELEAQAEAEKVLVEERRNLEKEKGKWKQIGVVLFFVLILSAVGIALETYKQHVDSLESKLVNQYVAPLLTSDSEAGNVNLAARMFISYSKGDSLKAHRLLLASISSDFVIGKHSSRIIHIEKNGDTLITVSTDSIKTWSLKTFELLQAKINSGQDSSYKKYLKNAEMKLRGAASIWSDNQRLLSLSIDGKSVSIPKDVDIHYWRFDSTENAYTIWLGSHRYLFQYKYTNGKYEQTNKYSIPRFGFNEYYAFCDGGDRFYLAYDNVLRAVGKKRVVYTVKETDQINNFYLTGNGNAVLSEVSASADSNKFEVVNIKNGRRTKRFLTKKLSKGNIEAVLQDPADSTKFLCVTDNGVLWKSEKKSTDKNLADICFIDCSMDYGLNYFVYVTPEEKEQNYVVVYNLKEEKEIFRVGIDEIGKPGDSFVVLAISSGPIDDKGTHRLFAVTKKGVLPYWDIIKSEENGKVTTAVVKSAYQPASIDAGDNQFMVYAHRLKNDASLFVACKKDGKKGSRSYYIYKKNKTGEWAPLAEDLEMGHSGIIPVDNSIDSTTYAIIRINSGLYFYDTGEKMSISGLQPKHIYPGDFTRFRFSINGEDDNNPKAYITTAKELIEFDKSYLLPEQFSKELIHNIMEEHRKKGKGDGEWISRKERKQYLE